MKTLNFNHNWNGKLNCDYFTTIRLYNEDKYKVGERFECYLKGQFKGVVEVVSVKVIYLHQINNWIAWLDTGYDVHTTQNILREMYKNKSFINWKSQQLSYVMLKKEKGSEQPRLF